MATDILMPALSPTMKTGTLARWLKKEGDTVAPGDVIAEIETDKATMEMEAVEEGILGRIFVPEGTADIAVNTPIAVMVEPGETVPEKPVTESGAPIKTLQEAEKEKNAQLSQTASSTKAVGNQLGHGEGQTAKGERLFISPLARRLAAEHGVAVEQIRGTGPKGRILRRDVEASLPVARPAEAPVTPVTADAAQEVQRTPHSTMRKVIARRLTESKTQVPHFYVSMDIELDALLALRSQLNEALADEGVRVSVNDMMIKAVALALRKLPQLNVQFTETELLQFPEVDISMAVSIPDGLITPIIRNADRKSLRDISREAKELVGRARAGKLKPEEFQGGTFSISNMGMFGVRDFAAIINPPQAAILAIGAGEKRPVVRGEALEIATVMTVTLSVDHRAIDGALGAQWLKVLRDIVQNPFSLVV
ncbi:pyruvate dehydrogenase complex dihydrolipoamide acetyltransferase [Oecophyllibacter saccharovorans]|uniref:pyruvate dehydrogenase complex dihydrolipoamide acetyltransferase n=1 Tax=Oecophyllibacter saccharovorans TaxID=2558360 RepID=UPI0011444E09|nr:pyruvate dehydrogenase complex dihydrolipoamide acetyltransferase [Oecophyllibacter saccharovorans]QDH15785.1 pyruvate dehydrogenase complex dihydrolipoamide acetyltransferase [Oecophyllibacter saccharovorans]